MALVVPTKDRPEDLRRMLNSVKAQSVHPEEIVIVDGSEAPAKDLREEISDLNIKYIRVYPPSLSKQRNAGMAAVDPSVTLAGYLDDDLVLEPGAIEAMLRFWENAPEDVGGARFNIIDEGVPRAIWVKSLFLLESRKRGSILPSGYHTSIGPVLEDTYVRWLSGGVTVWRKRVIDEFSYDEWFQGTGYLEDVDYSYMVGKKYKLAVVADGRVRHFSHPVRSESNYLLGKWQAINRMYFVKKHQEFWLPLCYWGMVGEFLLNLGAAITRIDSWRLRRAWGNLAGLAYVVQGRIEKTDGVLK
jgi:glycosyltransferase involved in cell wall biosynthesis